MPIISKKNLIFLIFGTVKIKNPRAVGKNRRILDQNVVVSKSSRVMQIDDWEGKQ